MVEAAQIEGTLNGILVLNTGDVIFHLGRFIDRPVTLEFVDGRVVDIRGGLDAFLLREHLASYEDPNALLAGHIAWGTDHRAKWTAPLAQFPEAGAGNADSEGYYGNVQIQIGSNNDQFFRGVNRSDAHIGMCILGANVELDGKPEIRAGVIVDTPVFRSVLT
jgi:2,5-dihydroxypyridine 5,6-dioxygenase